MDERLNPLFTPWKIGNCEIKNRIVMTSMGGTDLFGWMENNHFDIEGSKFIMKVARNNVGLVLPGCQPVYNPMFGQWLHKNKGMYKELAHWMPEFHKTGAKLFVQLTAGFGRSFTVSPMMEKLYNNGALRVLSKPFMDLDKITASASPAPNRWSDKLPSRAMTKEEIKEFVVAFGKTSKLLKDAGVDGVEVHAVHEGYLLDQFTLGYVNKRDDEYGGSFENRYRFAVEIVQEIKKQCGKDFPVSLRYSVISKTKGMRQGALPGEEYTEVGRDFEESKKAAKYLQDAGYDMLNCDNGTYDAWYWAHPPVYAPLNLNLSYVEHIKQFTTKPVVCAGRMQPDAAAASIAAGRIDAMGVGRQLLCDPAFITKIKEDRPDDIRPCISCHGACLPFNGMNGQGTDIDPLHVEMGRCVLNPWTNNETKYSKAPAVHPKKIAVVGGGIGGMEVAIQASKRGHKVSIYEKTGRLGGVFVAAAAMSFKEKDKELLAWYERQLKATDTVLHMNTEIADLDALDADVVVVATGASARTLRIPGAERAVTATDFLSGKTEAGDKVVIVGGGLTGCEIAYELALQGKHPEVVEMTKYLVGARGICMANSTMLRELLRYHKVPAHLESTVEAITDEGVVIRSPQGQKTLPADTVILSVGYTSDGRFNAADGKHLKKTGRGAAVYFVGDCDRVGSLKMVVKQAYELVQKLSYT
jgi:2-enoate reductase